MDPAALIMPERPDVTDMRHHSMHAVHAQVSCITHVLLCPVLETAELLSCIGTAAFLIAATATSAEKSRPTPYEKSFL